MEKHIALISDDGYVLPTIVCIQSIINSVKSAWDQSYMIHVCSFGFSEENTRRIESINSDNVTVMVHIFERRKFENKISQVNQKSHVTTTALIKFELMNYFSDLDKILYIDSDIIIKNNIDEIFEMNIDKYYLAASFEFWVRLNNLKYCVSGIKNEIFYFNSGVMLFNLKKMREEDISEKLWYYKLNNTKTKLMDQECFNSICGNSVLPLSIKWNFNPIFADDRYLEDINKVYNENYLTVEQMLKDVKIIHYVGKTDKPWVYSNAHMQSFWQTAFDDLKTDITLELKEYIAEKKNIFQKFQTKIKNYGIIGFLCFIKYSIKLKLKRN